MTHESKEEGLVDQIMEKSVEFQIMWDSRMRVFISDLLHTHHAELDAKHQEALTLAVQTEQERCKDIVEFERIHFWGTPELEVQTKVNNMVVDNILQALLTPPSN